MKQTHYPWAKRLVNTPLFLSLLPLAGLWLLPAAASAQGIGTLNLASAPPSAGGTPQPPNVLMVMDTSSSMDMDPLGNQSQSTDPTSRSFIARAAATNIVNSYGPNMNIGLMAYQQNAVYEVNLYTLYYGISFNSSNYNAACAGAPPGFSGAWTGCENQRRAQLFNAAGVNNPLFYFNANWMGVLYANFGAQSYYFYEPLNSAAGYYGAQANQPTGATQAADQPTLLNCINGRASIPGALNACYNFGTIDAGTNAITVGALGIWSAAESYGVAWKSDDISNASSYGYLHVPIAPAPLGSAQMTKLTTKLSTQRYDYGTNGGNAASYGFSNKDNNGWKNSNYPLENAGNTPMEGTLQTAQAYFNGTSADAAQGLSGVTKPVYNTNDKCSAKNYTVFLTDGLPSIRPGGVNDTTNNLNAGVMTAASNLLNSSAKVKTFFIGFGADVSSTSVPPGCTAATVMDCFAVAGGTDTAQSASDSASLDTAFQNIFTTIATDSLNVNLAPVAANSTQLNTDSVIYQSTYDTGDWSGHLFAYKILTDGTVVTPPKWDGGAGLPAYPSRNIVTYSKTNEGAHPTYAGTPFKWANLDNSQKTALQNGGDATNGQKIWAWLAGDSANEGAVAGTLRKRSVTKLGDIVNSGPTYVGKPVMNYKDSIETPAYSAFVAAQKDRTPMIYVGANDGMLHGFTADVVSGGQEKFAYVPNVLYPTLAKLTAQDYPHRFYVDGTPTVSDACLGSSPSCTWTTVLVGGLGAGGQGIYALDVTDPVKLADPTQAYKNVKWEFTDQQDADMGYTFSQPQIVKLRGGKWVAIFGNGYNNNDTSNGDTAVGSGSAVLYVVDLNTGALLKKLDTGVRPSGSGTDIKPNGLSTPAVLSTQADGVGDYVYAGDLRGNLWKFDLSGGSTDSWVVSFGGQPLYTAVSSTGGVQPITEQPGLAPNPKGGYMVYFGTGKIIETSDMQDTSQQSIYGVWDKNDGSTNTDGSGRSKLQQQTITKAADQTTYTAQYRIVSGNVVDWTSQLGWYMDLPDSGERQVTGFQFSSNGALVFSTTELTASASADSCSSNGFAGGWLMEVNPLSGAPLDPSPFDVNNDGKFDRNDVVYGPTTGPTTGPDTGVPPGGTRPKDWTGSPSEATILKKSDGSEVKLFNGVSKTPATLNERGHAPATGGIQRMSWRDISQQQ